MNHRSNSHLNNVTDKLAEKVGWSILMKWDHVGVFPFTDVSHLSDWAQMVIGFMSHLSSEKKKELYHEYMEAMKKIIEKERRPLRFPVQMYIFKK